MLVEFTCVVAIDV